jgi:hypothetical protein
VYYCYVENDVTVNAGEKVDGIATAKKLNLSLKAGWNSITNKFEYSYTVTEGTREDSVKSTSAFTYAYSLGDPTFKWILLENFDDDDDDNSYSVRQNRLMPKPAR